MRFHGLSVIGAIGAADELDLADQRMKEAKKRKKQGGAAGFGRRAGGRSNAMTAGQKAAAVQLVKRRAAATELSLDSDGDGSDSAGGGGELFDAQPSSSSAEVRH